LSVVLLYAAGCNNDFSPKQDYHERLVVFAVLTTGEPYQVVRLESTYDAESTNPNFPVGKKDITDATVSMTSMVGQTRKSYTFHDTIMTMTDGSSKKVWINRDLVPVESGTYTITVRASGFDPVTAAVQAPNRSYVKLVPPNIAANRFGPVLFAGAIGAEAPAKGFYFRLWLVAKHLVDGREVEIRREVPWAVQTDPVDTTYTKPGRQSSYEFNLAVIARLKNTMADFESAYGFEFVGTAYALDSYMYNYFMTVRGFDDPVSVRQDRPDVTNIQNGVGVFGAITVDSVRKSYSATVTPQ
jgi:hypothetical protein